MTTEIKPVTQENGVRPNIDKKKIMKSMTDEDWQQVHLKQEIRESFINDDDAKQCAIRSDQMYQQWHEKMGNAEGELVNILSISSKSDKLQAQLDRKVIIEKYPNTHLVMSERDLEIIILGNRQRVNDSFRNLWLILADLYRYVDQLRLDKVVFFTPDQYHDLMERFKSELRKNGGLDLYQDRT